MHSNKRENTNGSLTGKDLHYDSPYNTYEHGGLPPGPIGNPGEVALRAALAPAQTDYLYFVANTQGGHFFGATLAEHNKNVNRYHRLLQGLPADPASGTSGEKTGPSTREEEAANKETLKAHDRRSQDKEGLDSGDGARNRRGKMDRGRN